MTVNYNMRQLLLQSVTAISLQNPREVYYKMCQVFYYKTRQFHYKMLQSLQNVTTLITKYRLSLQIATVQYISITPIETGNT